MVFYCSLRCLPWGPDQDRSWGYKIASRGQERSGIGEPLRFKGKCERFKPDLFFYLEIFSLPMFFEAPVIVIFRNETAGSSSKKSFVS